MGLIVKKTYRIEDIIREAGPITLMDYEGPPTNDEDARRWKAFEALARIHAIPRAEVVIDKEEKVLELTIGMTVGEVRTLCQVPADWTAFVDEQPVADSHPILHDCFLQFQPGDGKALAVMCRAIRSEGRCQQPEDDRDWIFVTELRQTLPGKDLRGLSEKELAMLSGKDLRNLSEHELSMLADGDLRLLSEKQLRTLFRHEGIRTRKPSRQRLQVHSGDWLHFLARRARQQEQVLDAAAEPEEIIKVTDDMEAEARLIRLINGDG